MTVLLAIDPAAESGWAIFDGGRLHAHEEGAYGRAGRDGAVGTAVQLADIRHEGALVVVMEEWSLHGKWSNVAKRTVCEWGGRWLDSLEYHGIGRIHRVLVDDWRRGIFGKQPRHKAPVWKQMARQYAMGVIDPNPRKRRDLPGENEADAICIGAWGLKAPEVRALM